MPDKKVVSPKNITAAEKAAVYRGDSSKDENELNLFKLYLEEVGQHKLLTDKEERKLVKKVSKGDKAAKAKLTESNLRLVISIAKKFQNNGLELVDLVQEGNLGLMKAVECFDPARKCRFSTYATWWIRQAILRALANSSRTIRFPVHIHEKIGLYQKLSRQLNNNGELMTKTEIAEAMNITPAEVDKLKLLTMPVSSLDVPIGEDGDNTLGDIVEGAEPKPEAVVEEKIAREDIEACLNKLPRRERDIIRMRFGFGDGKIMTLEQIGKKMGVTRERIRQIEKNALTKIKISLKNYADYVA